MITNEKSIPSWSFWLQWTLVNTSGAILGSAVGFYVVVGSLSQTITTATIMLGFTLGASVGIMQSLVLRSYFYQVGWWILANTLGWTIGFGAGFPLSLTINGPGIMNFAIIGALIGTLTGVMQFFVLRQSGYRSVWWILVSILGWSIGFAIGANINSLVPKAMMVVVGEGIDEAVSLAVAGTVAGAITGISLMRLLQYPIINPEPKAPLKLKWKIGIGACITLFCLIMVVFFTNRQEQLNGLEFSELDRATRTQIQYPRLSGSSNKIIEINDPKKIEFAREFIKRYPDGWKRPGLAPVPAASFYVEFFDEKERVGVYGVGTDFLAYGLYWRPLPEEDRMLLIEALDIPAE